MFHRRGTLKISTAFSVHQAPQIDDSIKPYLNMASYSPLIRDSRAVDLSIPSIIRDKRPVDLTIRDDLHFQSCPLHDQAQMTKCSGRLKKGGSCSNKAIGPPILGTLPTCKVHRDQMKMMAWCQSPLPCGFQCRRLYEWEPHGIQLCSEHNHLRPCYFLKIPTELRLRIYQYLLPEKDIWAQNLYYNQPKPYPPWDGYKLFLDILFVNHQIHDEAIGVLYGTRFFNIDFDGTNLTMCNMATGPLASQMYMPGPGPVSNHSLPDYQMQLMLLEQQNKRRLMMARADLSTRTSSNPRPRPPISNPSSSSVISTTGFTNSAPTSGNTPTSLASFNPASNQIATSHAFPYMPPSVPRFAQMTASVAVTPRHYSQGDTAESIWVPPIKQSHFNLIQSFRIQISFTFPMLSGSATDEKSLESKLYESTDHLHRLVGRLCLTHKRIVQLEVSIKFGNSHHVTREKAFSCAQILLRPFQRLKNVVNPGVSSITTVGVHNIDNELLPTWNARAPEKEFADYVEGWFRSISSDGMASLDPPVFDAYWQLKKLLLGIKQHCNNLPKLEEFTDLLHAARVVREEDNLPQFREIWDRVVNVWFDYLNEEKEFQLGISTSIDEIYGTINGGEVEGKGKGRA